MQRLSWRLTGSGCGTKGTGTVGKVGKVGLDTQYEVRGTRYDEVCVERVQTCEARAGRKAEQIEIELACCCSIPMM